ncbi:MAG: hypothetical protein OEW15_02810 [Nitrospirota bacterium]|nr:hypothetical protein [Nitrospirota bacterium]
MEVIAAAARMNQALRHSCSRLFHFTLSLYIQMPCRTVFPDKKPATARNHTDMQQPCVCVTMPMDVNKVVVLRISDNNVILF